MDKFCPDCGGRLTKTNPSGSSEFNTGDYRVCNRCGYKGTRIADYSDILLCPSCNNFFFKSTTFEYLRAIGKLMSMEPLICRDCIEQANIEENEEDEFIDDIEDFQ